MKIAQRNLHVAFKKKKSRQQQQQKPKITPFLAMILYSIERISIHVVETQQFQHCIEPPYTELHDILQ